jgi:hypothetical protein
VCRSAPSARGTPDQWKGQTGPAYLTFRSHQRANTGVERVVGEDGLVPKEMTGLGGHRSGLAAVFARFPPGWADQVTSPRTTTSRIPRPRSGLAESAEPAGRHGGSLAPDGAADLVIKTVWSRR